VTDLDGDGYALADLVLAAHQCEHIASSLPALTAAGRAGVRDLISHPTVARLLQHERLGACLWSAIGRNLVAVKVTMFDKTPSANWRAQWHQDRAIAVKERLTVHGYGPWSSKNGMAHVEPPEGVLAQMVAIRIHLDDCGADNGPLRVIPGSHLAGKLSEAEIADMVATRPMVELSAPQGSLILMRPLLLHASSPSLLPVHRRVLHIEFAPREAISPLQWHTSVALRRAA
jgi:ectoine hydroxylase-related dioxygenase (phytanoyl-CoA dioxygenase family)